jgi:hypothetical protein
MSDCISRLELLRTSCKLCTPGDLNSSIVILGLYSICVFVAQCCRYVISRKFMRMAKYIGPTQDLRLIVYNWGVFHANHLALRTSTRSLHSTVYNRIRYTNLKIYCDQTNSNITTQFLTEHLLTLKVLLQVFNITAPGYAADIQTIF